MKKLFAVLLALMMLLSLAACGTGGEDPVLDPDDLEDIDDALEILEMLTPEGWDENSYGMYIYEVWDEAFLPDVLPGPVDGILADQTNFKDYKHDVINQNYSVGPIEYESYEDYREYSVSFYATEEQLDAYMDKMLANGFVGSADCNREDAWWQFDFSHKDGWVASIFFNTNADMDGAYDGRASISLTDCLYELPKSIAGIPLPQCGAIAYDPAYYSIQTFDDNGMDEPAFDLAKDTFPDGYYAAWFTYFGTVRQNAQDYAAQLRGLGWTVEHDQVRDDGDYYGRLVKGDVYCVIRYNYSDSGIELGFANMAELLDY